jgi:tetratricopeptide (TPR) repeat protein
MRLPFSYIPPRGRVQIATGVAVLIFALLAAWLIHRRAAVHSPQLATPMLSLDRLQAKSLYYNGPALPWLLERRPDLLVAADKEPRSLRAREFAHAVQNPKRFRQLDRQHRFDTLLLIGDPSQYRPLLEHLLEAKDWTLTYLDHASLVYRREADRPWQPAELSTLRGHFTAPREEAVFLAQAASKLLAIRMGAVAKPLLEEAEKLDPRCAEVWSGLATYHMSQGEWSLALARANRAVEIAPKSLAAIGAKAQVLFSTKKFSEALPLSARLVAARPDDPGLLFYHAKIAHEARAFREEIAALEKLVALAEREAQPASGYRLYLAQAYAADGQAEPSIKQFTRLLEDSELSKEQRTFAEETLAQIKSRSGH